jgi:hypothetical protein
VAGALRSVHQEYAATAEAAALQQPAHALGQLAVGERREFVEPGHHHRWNDELQDEQEHVQRQPDVQPPEFAHPLHQPEDRHQQGHADKRREQHLLGEVGQVEPPGHAVEAEALLDDEGAVERERQVQSELDKEQPDQ